MTFPRLAAPPGAIGGGIAGRGGKGWGVGRTASAGRRDSIAFGGVAPADAAGLTTAAR
ncbi:MAG: hypothetical protein JO288_11080 [Hyphomicrobiales bacterium]|nr:hypothetical protein [Hyphomicrobiales bacterium]